MHVNNCHQKSHSDNTACKTTPTIVLLVVVEVVVVLTRNIIIMVQSLLVSCTSAEPNSSKILCVVTLWIWQLANVSHSPVIQ